MQRLGWVSWGSLLGQAPLCCTVCSAEPCGNELCSMPWALHTCAHVCTHSRVNAHACTSLCMAKCLLGPARAFHQNIWGCRAAARHWGLTYTRGARRARALPQVGCRGCQGHLSASALSSPLAVCFPRPAPSRRAEASERRPTATSRLLQRPFPRSAIPWPRLKAGPTMRYCARLLGGEAAAGAKTRLPGRGGEGGGRAHAHQHPNALLGSWGSWMVPKIPHPGVGMLPEMLPRPLPCSILLGERGG